MGKPLVALILAAGRDSRVRPFSGPNESYKPMIKFSGKRLIEIVIDSLSPLGCEIAVMSARAPESESLDKIVERRGLKLLKESAGRRMPPVYSIFKQYNWSEDSDYLRGFYNIMILPADVIVDGVDFRGFYQFHLDHLNHLELLDDRQVTMLCHDGAQYPEKSEWLKLNGDRVMAMSRRRPKTNGYIPSYQAGIYIVTTATLNFPIAGMVMYALRLGFKYTRVIRYVTDGDWKDFGNPEDLLRYKSLIG